MNTAMEKFVSHINGVPAYTPEQPVKRPTAFQAIKIREIDRLTSGGSKTHRED